MSLRYIAGSCGREPLGSPATPGGMGGGMRGTRMQFEQILVLPVIQAPTSLHFPLIGCPKMTGTDRRLSGEHGRRADQEGPQCPFLASFTRQQRTRVKGATTVRRARIARCEGRSATMAWRALSPRPCLISSASRSVTEGAGPGRRLAKLMRELGWSPIEGTRAEPARLARTIARVREGPEERLRRYPQGRGSCC